MTDSAPDTLSRLLEVMARLRDPERGCPWDLEQSYATIAPYTIEEAYEVADAVDRADWDGLRDELGDLLLQVVYFARMAEEDGRFDFSDVARGIADKMVARHPHVFGEQVGTRSADEQTHAWEAQKARERQDAGADGTLDGVALGLPALTRALKLQKRAARVGFDWDDIDGVLAKVAEELAELAEVREAEEPDQIEAEFGDLLFSLVNAGRHLGLDPEAALRRANAKFVHRFEGLEARLAREGSSPFGASPAELDALWEAVKRQDI